jgi:hypothetical protein
LLLQQQQQLLLLLLVLSRVRLSAGLCWHGCCCGSDSLVGCAACCWQCCRVCCWQCCRVCC